MADTIALMLSTLRKALETNYRRLLRDVARLNSTVDFCNAPDGFRASLHRLLVRTVFLG